MLTRKQMWRRVRPGRFVEPTPATPQPPSRTNSSKDSALCARRPGPAAPINSLSIGDSLLHLLGNSVAAPDSDDSGEGLQNPEDAADLKQEDDAGSPKTVSFKSQVRVVLVPCRRELHSLNAQLWWSPEDYVDFRREYILAVKAAAAASQAQQQDAEEQQQRSSQNPKEAPSALDEAREDGIDTLPPPPPTPRCPPSPLSSASLSTPLPPTNAEAAAAAAKATVGTSSGQREHEQRSCGAPDGVRLATSIPPEALAAAAAVATSPPISQEHERKNVPQETAEQQQQEEEEAVTSFRPPRATSRASCVRTKWTPFAGAAAAKAAAEESEESGYRTMSMSSVSDNAFGGCTSDSDDDEGEDAGGYESDQEDEGRAALGDGGGGGSNKRIAVACSTPREEEEEEEEQNLLLQGRA